MAVISARVLVVDDHELWRQFLCSKLLQHSGLRIVAEASDGLEAIQIAHKLKPDLILLDIEIPTLSGIEVARQLRSSSLSSKILFLTGNTSIDIVNAALEAGAHGYIVKLDAATELLPAVNALLQGRSFVGKRFRGFSVHAQEETPVPITSSVKHGHVVQFYEDDETLLDGLCARFRDTLAAGGSAIAIMTSSHRRGLEGRLTAAQVDIAEAQDKGQLKVLDAAASLKMFMGNGIPKADHFLGQFADLIQGMESSALKKNIPVFAFGEMVALLWAQRMYQATFQLEELWNELARSYFFDLHCAYPASEFHGNVPPDSYASICAKHSYVLPH